MTFEVPGRPHAKQRPRVVGRVAFTPKETVNAETFIRLTAAPHFPAPIDGPVSIEITAVFVPAASWSKAKQARALGGPHVQRPDLDNLAKSATDALNGVAYFDDGQIAEMTCRKVWGPAAKTVVTVRPMRGGTC